MHALRPSFVSGTLIVTFLWILASGWACAIIPSYSSAVTSAEIGPSTIVQISAITSSNLRPSLATREGLVVTPSRMPRRAASLISSMFAVSMKNFMGSISLRVVFGARRVVGIR